MAHDTTQATTQLQLPLQVITRVDVGRLLREADSINDFLTQSALRRPGTAVKPPRTSQLFEELSTANRLNVLHDDDRARMVAFLKDVYAHAPVLHMSFSSDPSPVFLQKLIAWLRSNLHPGILLQVGMQPNMGAGCVVRTTNKYFDFSLRSRLKESSDVLAKLMKEATA